MNRYTQVIPCSQKFSLYVLAIFFIVAGTLHFAFTPAYVGIMPPWLPWHHALVAISGVGEITGGVGVLMPRLRHFAGYGLIALCLAVLPANVQMFYDACAASKPVYVIFLLFLRLPAQFLLMWWIRSATRQTWVASART